MRVENPHEAQFLRQLVVNLTAKLYWLDGSDDAKEGTWVFSNGKEMSYFDWGPKQPTNDTHPNQRAIFGDENHLLMTSDMKFKWNDVSSDTRCAFICEWDDK